MTLSPEERAEAIVERQTDDIIRREHQSRPVEMAEEWEALIATAIREAENAALERAEREARFAHLGMSCFVSADDRNQYILGMTAAADRIAALKHPKD